MRPLRRGASPGGSVLIILTESRTEWKLRWVAGVGVGRDEDGVGVGVRPSSQKSHCQLINIVDLWTEICATRLRASLVNVT